MIPSWVIFAGLGYFLLAFTGVADKFLVSKVVREPIAPRAHTSGVKGIGSFRCQQDGNRFLAVHGFMNLTSAG